MSKVKGLKFTMRLLLLAGALFFIIGGPLPVWMERLVPALSPLSLFAESIAQRSWYAGLFWSLPPLAVLLLAVFKGRFFCQWICPLGTLYSLPQKIGPKKRVLPFRLNALLFWTVLTSSVLGLSALLWLDPLSTVSRAGALAHAAAWIPGLMIPLFLLLSVFQPQVWCTHLCPLGYSFDLLNRKTGKNVLRRDRRQFIAGLGLGGAAAAIFPKSGKGEASSSVLPPGATEKFAETCSRCYACVSACPAEIIKVKKGGPLGELAMPELVFDYEYGCEESCNRCSQACPTGAIRALSHEEKWKTQIGKAKVKKGRCLAWADNEYCMVCDEYCPYSAIETVWKDDVACPVVKPDLCRGCGACEANCPAPEGKAIFVRPVSPQQKIVE
ncbi:4Fe-4S binding protein [Tichowtungia aerotolerans]|uniref:4Fe-4S binding protein n=1 Tax=Tichowtungia aerotolerans TaxID=2697043 RepID=A0A6P1MEF8_9BACT|nr:4Fe-4S binding protein [Tichowtungia aerotolerans]QHI69996.1 4Fe-4S binding protein [Tichowtungia aerotolerans]